MNYNYPLVTVLLLSTALVACSKKIGYLQTSEVKFLDNPYSGTVTVESIGYGDQIKEAEINAIQKAFQTIIYQGLPAFSGLSTPMIPDRTKVDQSILERFFSRNEYSEFLTGQEDVRVLGKLKNPRGYKVSKVVTINYNSLRRGLEKKGVVRKFGL
jgi:hypothetical protein